MRTTLATAGAAFLLAGTAYVMPAHAQPAAPSVQFQPYGGTSQTSPIPGWVSRRPSHTRRRLLARRTRSRLNLMPVGQTQTQPSGMTTQAPPSGMANQPRAYSASTQTQGQLPQGSYASSCKDARMDGQTLIAFCRKPDGTWQTSALRTQQCTGDIQDVNGNLTCGAANQYSVSTPPTSPAPQRGY
jgi:hypothetical protein